MNNLFHTNQSKFNNLYAEAFHESFIFPENTNETVTFIAGGTANVFGTWLEIVDNNTVAFSSKGLLKDVHISSVLIESLEEEEENYVFEIGYGDNKINVARGRMIRPRTLLPVSNPVSYQHRLRNLKIPAGEIVYYRMKCGAAAGEALVHIRYHYHGGI